MSVDHSFVVPAYGLSPHLHQCLESLRAQTLGGSEVLMATSTPSAALEKIASDYGVTYRVHGPNRGIGRDWNAALGYATRGWVTIAHQDDIYLPSFLMETMRLVDAVPDASLVMTDYAELLADTGALRDYTSMLRIKSLLLELGFFGRRAIGRPGDKLRLLKFGCPVPCPSITLGPALKELRFREDLKVDLDWEAWIRAARLDGSFCYVRRKLLHHRIHSESETSAGVRGGDRAREDHAMFAALWPRPIAAVLARAYALSYEAGKP